MTKKIVNFMTTILLILVAIFSLISLVSCEKVGKGPIDDGRQIAESIRGKYTHQVYVFSLTKLDGTTSYFAYWSVPKVTVHLDGTETTEDLVQVHRYNKDGEYVDFVVADTLEDAMDLFETKF